MRILVTGGGTGGHTTPAVATIQAIRELAQRDGWAPEFAYLGSKHGMEGGVASELGIPFIGIETGKLRRSRSLIGLISIANIRDMLRVPIGYAQAIGAVRKFKPDVVLSTGGYVSVPGVLAAGALNAPVVAHEQTVQVGLANRINFRVARKIAVSVDETLSVLTDDQRRRAVVTGNPVRQIVFGGDASRAARKFGFDPGEDALPTIYVTGGAQGSRLINRAIGDALAGLLPIARTIHQCGAQAGGAEQDFELLTAVCARLPENLAGRYALTRFVGPEIGDVYALADLVVGRSGAGTVTEVCALGKPAIFVPLVPTSGDEQTRNAARLVNSGAALVIRQDELSGERLLRAVEELVRNPGRLQSMGRCAKELAQPNAAMKLAELVVELGRASHG